MANGIRTGDSCGFNKGRSSKFHEGSQVQQTPEDGRGHIDRNVEEITIKMKTIVWKPLMIKKIKVYMEYGVDNLQSGFNKTSLPKWLQGVIYFEYYFILKHIEIILLK